MLKKNFLILSLLYQIEWLNYLLRNCNKLNLRNLSLDDMFYLKTFREFT